MAAAALTMLRRATARPAAGAAALAAHAGPRPPPRRLAAGWRRVPAPGSGLIKGGPRRLLATTNTKPDDDNDDGHSHGQAYRQCHGHNHGHSHSRAHSHGGSDGGGRSIVTDDASAQWHGLGACTHTHGAALDELLHSGRAASRITWIGVWCNVGLSVAKVAGGIVFRSESLLADAAHSISDLVSDFVTLLGVKWARKPADRKYPYGYGRHEVAWQTLGSATVAGLLVAAGVGIGLHSYGALATALGGSARHVHDLAAAVGHAHAHGTDMHAAAVGIALASVIVKELLYRATIRVAAQTNSSLLAANAWHHRSDAFSSLVALAGVGGAYLGMPLLDPLGGLLVAGMITQAGVVIGWRAVQELIDGSSATQETVKAVEDALAPITRLDGEIRNVHGIRCRRMGPYTLVDLHMQVDPLLSVSAAHQAEARVRRLVQQQLPQVSEVLVHVDVEEGEALTPSSEVTLPPERIEAGVRAALAPLADVKGVAHVLVHYLDRNTLVEVQVHVDPGLRITEARDIARRAKVAIEQLPEVDEAHVDVEINEEHRWERLQYSRPSPSAIASAAAAASAMAPPLAGASKTA